MPEFCFTMCIFTDFDAILYVVERQISMLFVDNNDSVAVFPTHFLIVCSQSSFSTELESDKWHDK